MRYEIVENLETSVFEIRKTRKKNHTFRKSRVAKKYLNKYLSFFKSFNETLFFKELLEIENLEIFKLVQEQAHEALRLQRNL